MRGLLSIDEFHPRAWRVMEPVSLERVAGLVERFGTARASQLGDDRPPQVADAAAAGRVGVLLLEAARQVPGRLDATTGIAQADVLTHPDVDDMLDDLAEVVLRKGGEVVLVPTERFPTTTGLAAVYRN